MTATMLVTGATGLVGSQVCVRAIDAGFAVRALVRRPEDAAALAALGAEPVEGDVTDAERMVEVAAGADVVVHTAALVGGASPNLGDYEAVNIAGTANMLNAAAASGARLVSLATPVIFEQCSTTFTEDSPLAFDAVRTPYCVTKTMAHRAVQDRIAGGQPVLTVTPGGVYGPSPLSERAMAPTTFNFLVRRAVRGEIPAFLPLPVGWVLAEDVACCIVAAVQRWRSGAHYLALGRPDDVCTVANFLDRACQRAGVVHRVAEVDADDPMAGGAFPANLKVLARRGYPTPLFDNSATMTALGYRPTGLDTGLDRTLAWMPSE